MTTEGFILTGADQIRCYHLAVLKGAVKLEGMGYPRSQRPSATTIAKRELNLPMSTPRAVVLARLEETYKAALEGR